jgi:hypothetical protein
MHRRFGLEVAGWTGLIGGVALMALGAAGGDIAGLMRGYGLLLALSAAWLLGGLALRAAVSRHRAAARVAGTPAVRQTR